MTYTLNTALSVKAATKYTVQVRALGANGYSGVWSSPVEFTWQEPVAAGEVPWPARPLPPLVDWNTGIAPKLVTAQDFVLNADPLRIILPNPSRVHIRIGTFEVTGVPSNDLNWNIEGTVFADDAIQGYLRYRQVSGSSVLNPASPALLAPRRFTYHKAVMAGDIATYDFESSLLPVVLYRQQTGRDIEGTMQPVTGADIIQVSPAITGISYTITNVSTNTGPQPFMTVTDPYVLVTGQPQPGPNPSVKIDLGIADTAPVAEGSRYKYWLVHLDAYGEIDAIIPAGEITIP